MNHPAVVDRPSRLLEGLNPEQLAAVTLPAEPALILAGAGSGKTRVLTTRVAWLIQTGQLSPGGVMAVTFTNKAAKEMLTRLDAMLAIPVRGMWVGTFHGLCNRFLRAHWKLAALPQGFQILDSSDQLSAVKRIVKAMNLDEERHPPKQLTWAIAGAKDDGLRAKDIEVKDEQSRILAQVYEAYDAQCQREGVVDFAELMLRTYELLRDNGPLREHYQRRFRHILVDEFQDTNRLQYAWLKMFAGPPEHGCALFCVGDDDQSIYAFRGAQVGNMAAFEREYRVRTVVKLERNYRSYGNILDAANELISRNSRRLGKNLRTEAGPGRAGARARGAVRLRRGAVVHRGGAVAAPRRHAAPRDRAALPQQRAEPGDGERALQRRHPVQGLRRAALLRARRGQARALVPAPDREPERRHQLPARRQLPGARHRRAHDRAAAGRGAGERPQPLAERRLGRAARAARTCSPSRGASTRCASRRAA